MKQIVRRAIYFLFGALPASLGAAYAIFLGPFVIAAAAGAIGLIVASLMRFPLPPKSYGRIALLLICGLIIAVPFGVTLLYGSLIDGVVAEKLPALALIIWVFFGPVFCATHFLWVGRRAPNNSFNPMPLRGTG